MQKGKQGTSRVACYKDLQVMQSYTFETSFNGSNDKDDFEIADYLKMGEQFFQILGNYLVRKHIVSLLIKIIQLIPDIEIN